MAAAITSAALVGAHFDRKRAGRGIARWALVFEFVVVAVKETSPVITFPSGPTAAREGGTVRSAGGEARKRLTAVGVNLDNGHPQSGDIWIDVPSGTALGDNAVGRHNSTVGFLAGADGAAAHQSARRSVQPTRPVN